MATRFMGAIRETKYYLSGGPRERFQYFFRLTRIFLYRDRLVVSGSRRFFYPILHGSIGRAIGRNRAIRLRR